MRLTEKNKNGRYGFITENNTLGIFDENSLADKCYTKLGQLEDIEEELGIDLITLYKAMINSIALHLDNGIFMVYGYPHLLLHTKEENELGLLNKLLIGKDSYYLKDYGKTWALTKEELEK